MTIINSDYLTNMPFVIEMDLVEISGVIYMYYQGSTYNIKLNDIGHYYIEFKSTGVIVKKDNSNYTSGNAPTDTMSITFSFPNSTNAVTFKNLVIYLI